MEPSQFDLCKFTVLYVENDSDPLELVGRMLYKKYPDFKILFAENEADAISVSTKHHPDIYLVDIDVAGDKLIQHLRSNFQSHVIVIYNDEHDKEKCSKLSTAEYITKPVNMGSLLPKIDAIAEDIFWQRLNAARGCRQR